MIEQNHICKKCGGIAGWDSYFQSWVCTRCGNQEPKPKTNTDRIRSMTDEELAEIMVSDCPPNYPQGDCREYEKWDGNLDCQQCWLDWLRQEKKESET